MNSFWKEILLQSRVRGARSTILHPLQWLLAILLPSAIASVVVNAPVWMIIGLSSASLLDLLFFFAAYLYFGFNDPDALRSEKFVIDKMVIERGLLGDNIQGLLEPEHTDRLRIGPDEDRS